MSSVVPAANVTMCPLFLKAPQNDHRIAYHFSSGSQPCIMFLSGFGSNMEGSKATHLELFAKAKGLEFVRFDYRGHGQSDGEFLDSCLSDWLEDAQFVFDNVTSGGPTILVGSSMGGWIALLLALQRKERVQGLVGLAAAPDFLNRRLNRLTQSELESLRRDGLLTWQSEYDGYMYRISKKMFEDGVQHNLLDNDRLSSISCPVRLIHGTKDNAVPWHISAIVLEQIGSSDAVLTVLKDSEHRLAAESDLQRMCNAVEELVALCTKK